MVKANQEATEHVNKKANDLFIRFIQSDTCNSTFSTFLNFCEAANLHYPPSSLESSNAFEHVTFYPRLKKKLSSSWKAKSIFSKLDKRFNGKEYYADSKTGSSGQKAGEDLKIFIIGAGPCGLRTAIEMSCMGAKVVVVEKRDNFSRNNILHLWPFLITDLKTLGAKKIYGRFCAGSLDHISIRQLQLILLKVALILGVEIIFNVSFERLIPPFLDEQNEELTTGWRAEVGPQNHPITNYEFDVIVGADGKRNTLKGFKRKEFRGKLAIGLTVNFINRNTSAEAKVEEISGVAYIFNQEFFKNLHNDTGIDLENIVYYKGETHYFVMTAKKHSLLMKGVLRQDFDETSKLLSRSNVDHEALKQYTKEAADFSTHHQLPKLEFAFNQYGQADVALFDFTCMYAAENAALFREEKGCKLLSCLVGDSLLEPFWPMGTGCARGFFASFDAAWLIKQWSVRRSNDRDCTAELQILAERESIYRLLHQTTPESTMKKYAAYTIDPTSRYMNLNTSFVKPHQVIKYYLADRDIGHVMGAEAHESPKARLEDNLLTLPGTTLSRKVSMVRSNKLLSWCKKVVGKYQEVNVQDLSSSWKSGLALCAIIHRFRPDLIDWDKLDPEDFEKNNQMAFTVAEEQLGISPVMTGKEMATCEKVDKLLMLTYLSQLYEIFKYETPPDEVLESAPKTPTEETPRSPPKSPLHNKLSLTSPIGLLIRFTQHMKRRGSTAKKYNQSKRKKSDDAEETADADQLPVLKEIEEEKEKESESPPLLRIGDVEVKLRQKAPGTDRAQPKTGGRVSALSDQLMSKFQQNSPDAVCVPTKRQVDVTEIPVSSSSSQCYFCHERVHVFERTGAEGVFFHRNCFVCSHCGITLRRGAYVYEEDTGKFFCHKICQKDAKTCSIVISPSVEDKQFFPQEPDEGDGIASHRTPERIELENIRMSMLENPQELPEEDVTRHNLGIGEIGSEDETETMSDSSDDEDLDWNFQTAPEDLQESEASSSFEEESGSTDNRTLISWLSCDNDVFDGDVVTNRAYDVATIAETRASDASLADISTDSNASAESLADISTPLSERSNISLADISTDENIDDEVVLIASKPVSSYEKHDSSLSEHDSSSNERDDFAKSDPDLTRYADLPNRINVATNRPVTGVSRSRSLSSASTQSSASASEYVVRHDDVIATLPTVDAAVENENLRMSKSATPKMQTPSDSKLLPVYSEEIKPELSSSSESFQKLTSSSGVKITKSCKNVFEKRQDDVTSVFPSPPNFSKRSSESELDELEVLSLLEEKSTPDNTQKVAGLLKKEVKLLTTPGEPPAKPARKTLPHPPLTDSVLIRASSTPIHKPKEMIKRHGPSQSFNEGMLKSYLKSHVMEGTPQRKYSFDNFEQRVKRRQTMRNQWLAEDSNFGKPLTRSQSDCTRKISLLEQAKSASTTPTKKPRDVVIESTPPITPITIAWEKPPKVSEDTARSVPTVSDSEKSAPITPDTQLNQTKPLPKKRTLPQLSKVTAAWTESGDGEKARFDDETNTRKKLMKEKIDWIKAQEINKQALNMREKGDVTEVDGRIPKTPVDPKKSDKESRVKRRLPVPNVRVLPARPSDSPVYEENVDKSSLGDGYKKNTKSDKTTAEPNRKVSDEIAQSEKKKKPLFPFASRQKHGKAKDQRATSTSSQSTEHSTDLPSTSETTQKSDESQPKPRVRRKLPHVNVGAKIKRKAEVAARRQAKLESQQRLRRAQTIQRSLEELEVKQRRLEERGVQLENLLRSVDDAAEEPKHMLEWFELVQEKNALLRYENELMIHQRELQLEDEQSRLQQKLREIMALEEKRTAAQLREEKEVLQKMMDVVDQREELRAILDEQKMKERDETFNVESVILKKFDTESKDVC